MPLCEAFLGRSHADRLSLDLAQQVRSERRLPFLRRRRFPAARPQQRREHLLQAADKDVGLPVALKQRRDLHVFGLDLIAEEIAIVVQLLTSLSSRATWCDVVGSSDATCRDRSELVVGCISRGRGLCSAATGAAAGVATDRDASRLGATGLNAASSSICAMCRATDCGVTKYLSPNAVATF